MKVLVSLSTVLRFAFWLAVVAVVLGVVLGAGGGAKAPAGPSNASNARLSFVVDTWRPACGEGVGESCRLTPLSA